MTSTEVEHKVLGKYYWKEYNIATSQKRIYLSPVHQSSKKKKGGGALVLTKERKDGTMIKCF